MYKLGGKSNILVFDLDSGFNIAFVFELLTTNIDALSNNKDFY